MQQDDWLVFTGGGTGGHVFPGLAVIDELRQRGITRIAWIGSRTGMECSLLAARKEIAYYRIPSGKMRRYISPRNITDLFKITAGFFSSLHLLRKLRPRLLFSKGGYVTVPPVLAARCLGIPVITHESDSDPGIATRINALSARRILTSFPETADFFPAAQAAKVSWTGNPVRSGFFEGDKARGKALVGCPPQQPLLLVLGGSQGSAAINAAVLENLEQLCTSLFVVHQMGPGNFRARQQTNYYPAPFFGDELADLLAAADLVLCRAGSNTLWELAAAATPAILVPLTTASSRGDQLRNAQLFRQKGAAEIVEEKELAAQLLAIILNLINNKTRLKAMQQSLRDLSHRQSAAEIADIIIKEMQYAGKF